MSIKPCITKNYPVLDLVGAINLCKERTRTGEAACVPPHRSGPRIHPRFSQPWGHWPQEGKQLQPEPCTDGGGHAALLPQSKFHFAFCRRWMWLIFPSEGYVITCHRPHRQLSHKCWIASCAHSIMFNAQKFYKSPNPQKVTWQQGSDWISCEAGSHRGSLSHLHGAPRRPFRVSPCPSPPCIGSLVKRGFKCASTTEPPREGCYQLLAARMGISSTVPIQCSPASQPFFWAPSHSFPVCFLGNVNQFCFCLFFFFPQNSRKVTSVWLTLLQLKRHLLYLIEADECFARCLLYGFTAICNHSGKGEKKSAPLVVNEALPYH